MHKGQVARQLVWQQTTPPEESIITGGEQRTTEDNEVTSPPKQGNNSGKVKVGKRWKKVARNVGGEQIGKTKAFTGKIIITDIDMEMDVDTPAPKFSKHEEQEGNPLIEAQMMGIALQPR